MLRKKHLLKALLLGTVIGGVTGVLFAPKSGKETRKDIVRGYLKVRREVSEKVDDLVNLTYAQYERIVQTIVDKYSQIKDLSLEQTEILKKKLMEEWEDIEKERKNIVDKQKGVK